MSHPFAIVPRQPSGDWGVTLPGDASIGEVLVYAHPSIPPHTGPFIRVHQTGVDPAFDQLTHQVAGVDDGPGTNVVDMDVRVLCRFDPTATVYLMSLEEQSNLMFWTFVEGGNFKVNYVSTWSPYLATSHTVAIPSDITAPNWLWLRQRVVGGDLILDYSLDHLNPSPTVWTPLGTWTVSSLIMRPSFGDGKPWTVGIQLSGATAATGNLDLRRISYSFNSASPILATFEVDPGVVATAFIRTVQADTANGNDYRCQLSLPVTVESE